MNAGRVLDMASVAAIWLAFLVGLIRQDVWIAAPAAFLILLDTLSDQR